MPEGFFFFFWLLLLLSTPLIITKKKKINLMKNEPNCPKFTWGCDDSPTLMKSLYCGHDFERVKGYKPKNFEDCCGKFGSWL
jgi:hypothetical protein